MAEETATRQARIDGYRAGVEAVKRAVLDIDAHATSFGEDDDGFVTGGYIISVGSLHRALGIVGHTAPKCRHCNERSHGCDFDQLRMVDALRVARDFITSHPAVRGEWPLLVEIIDKAIEVDSSRRAPSDAADTAQPRPLRPNTATSAEPGADV